MPKRCGGVQATLARRRRITDAVRPLGVEIRICEVFDPARDLTVEAFAHRLALIHASLADTRLVTTPIVLTALVRNDVLSPEIAEGFLDDMSDARIWSANTYVARARSTLQQQRKDE